RVVSELAPLASRGCQPPDFAPLRSLSLSNMPSPDVLIVGAGPVGLTMAAALTRHGLACRIIDKAPAPSDKSKALAVWSRTLELLDGLDLAETFVGAGMKIR